MSRASQMLSRYTEYELASYEQASCLHSLDSASMSSRESITAYAVGGMEPWRCSNLSNTWRIGTW